MARNIFDVADMILCIITCVLHSIGIYLLRNVQFKKFNVNNILVTSLSGWEIVMAISCVLDYFLLWNDVSCGTTVMDIIFCSIRPIIVCTIVLITVNRFMACVYPIYYRKLATKKIVAVMMIAWMIAVVAGEGIWRVGNQWPSQRTSIYLYSSLGVHTIVFVLVCYAYIKIYLVLAKSSRRVSRHLPGKKNLKLSSILWNFIFHQGHQALKRPFWPYKKLFSTIKYKSLVSSVFFR